MPPFFEEYLISNDMIFIICKLLHSDPANRFKDINEVKEHFVRLKHDILETPLIMRQLLGHPVLPAESFYKNEDVYTSLNERISFKNNKLSEFGLKYLAKFVASQRVGELAINGGGMPLHQIKADNLILLNLSENMLFSEDLFILAQFLKQNTSISHINLSRNFIGLKAGQEREFKSLGLEHLAIALSQTSRILELDLSYNEIGAQNFNLLQRIFKVNTKLELLNLANIGIDGVETKNLCEGLLLNQKLKYLYLRNNSLMDVGSEAISKLILVNQSMIELDLYNCKINENGGNLIGTALK